MRTRLQQTHGVPPGLSGLHCPRSWREPDMESVPPVKQLLRPSKRPETSGVSTPCNLLCSTATRRRRAPSVAPREWTRGGGRCSGDMGLPAACRESQAKSMASNNWGIFPGCWPPAVRRKREKKKSGEMDLLSSLGSGRRMGTQPTPDLSFPRVLGLPFKKPLADVL